MTDEKAIEVTTSSPRQEIALVELGAAEKAGTYHRIYFDGSANPNPGGRGGVGVVVQDPQGNNLALISDNWEPSVYITNNTMEYAAAIGGMQQALALGVRQLILAGDSMLVVQQLQGKWKVKEAVLKRLHAVAHKLLLQFEGVAFQHVPREQNQLADNLSKGIYG